MQLLLVHRNWKLDSKFTKTFTFYELDTSLVNKYWKYPIKILETIDVSMHDSVSPPMVCYTTKEKKKKKKQKKNKQKKKKKKKKTQ